MALARFVSSDVYVFYDVEGGITCMLCQFMPTTEVHHHEKGSPFECMNCAIFHTNFNTDSRTEMIEHLRRHREAGDRVPDYAFEKLEKDIREHGDDANEG
jgi:hypothetical protein